MHKNAPFLYLKKKQKISGDITARTLSGERDTPPHPLAQAPLALEYRHFSR